MPAVSEHIWALLTTADDNHSWQTSEGPPGTHLPKPPLIVLTAVKQGIDSPERINQTPGGKKLLQGGLREFDLCTQLQIMLPEQREH